MKQNKKSCFCLQKVFRKMSTVEFISGKVTDTAACNFLETNSTAIVCQNFHIYFKQSKWNKLPLPLGRSQENVHDGVHFWNSYRYCCSQLLKKSSTLVGSKDFSKSFETKYIKKLCLPSVHFKKNACQRSSFSRSYWVLPPTFWKNNSTVVISKVFPKSFETKQIKKLCLPSELFQKMFTMKFISGKITDFYFQP